MNILFDIGHPAHVHLFKNFIRYLKKNGHHCIISIRDKDVTKELLDELGFEYHCHTKPAIGLLNSFLELLIRDWKLLQLHLSHKFDLAFGTSVSIGHLSMVSQLISYNFNEDDDDVVPLYTWLAYPFSSFICNPSCLHYKHWKKKRLIHDSYHELAYLHPNNFTPDEKVIAKYGLKKQTYIIARFSALTAHHDKNEKGISDALWQKISDLFTPDYQIIISVENNKSYPINPSDMHHVLAFAKLVISDSQTMTAESAILGVPSIRCNTFVGRISYLEELEQRYFLTSGFLPYKDDQIYNKVDQLLSEKDLENRYQDYRKIMLKDKSDLNQWMIKLFEDSFH